MRVPFLPLMYSVLQLFVLMGLGFLLRRKGGFSSSFFQDLSTLLVRIFLPLYFFARFSRTSLSQLATAWMFPLAAVVIALTGLVAATLLGTLIPRLDREERKAYLALASFGNSGYLPITNIELLALSVPLVAERFGTHLPGIYVGAYLVGSSTLLWTAGYALITGTTTRSPLTLLTPTVRGILAGLSIPLLGLQEAFFHPSLPFTNIVSTLDTIGSTTLPLVLLCLGAMLADISVSREERKAYLGAALTIVGLRLLILPALFYLAYFLFLRDTLTPPQLWVLFLETHTPPATNLSIMAQSADTHKEIAGISLFTSYLAYLILFPLSLVLFLSLLYP